MTPQPTRVPARLQHQPLHQQPHLVANMSDLKKSELRQELEKLGERPPTNWTKIQLKYRLEELTGQDMSVSSKSRNKKVSEMSVWVKELNKNKEKRKTEFISWCERELAMTNLDSYTKARIEMEAMKKIMTLSEPDGSDPVSFGKYGPQTYAETARIDPSYCRWVVHTAKTNAADADPRLIRFSRWLNDQDQREMVPAENPVTTKYPLQEPKTVTMTTTTTTSTASSSGYQQQMSQLVETVAALRDEVAALQSRRRGRLPSRTTRNRPLRELRQPS